MTTDRTERASAGRAGPASIPSSAVGVDADPPVRGERMTQFVVVARSPLDRWALVDALGLDPSSGLDPAEGFARLVHPCNQHDGVVLVADDDLDVVWLRRLRASVAATDLLVVALVEELLTPERVTAAGATSTVAWVRGTAPPADDIRAQLAADRPDEPPRRTGVVVVPETHRAPA